MHSVIGQGLTASFAIDHHRSSFFWRCVRSLRCLHHIHDYGDCRDVKLWSKIIEMVMGIHELTDYWFLTRWLTENALYLVDERKTKKTYSVNAPFKQKWIEVHWELEPVKTSNMWHLLPKKPCAKKYWILNFWS